MRIVVLGCGPSGLVAAHSAFFHGQQDGVSVRIFSHKAKSPIFGAQYLHSPIPFTGNQNPRVIRYVLEGAPEDYLRKVYGNEWDGTINDEMRTQAFAAWDLRMAYESLWKSYEGIISDADVTADLLENTLKEYDLVINTIPRPALCLRGKHMFHSTEIWAAGDTDHSWSPVQGRADIIDYNGKDEPSWYRRSKMFGYSTVEWPGRIEKPPFDGVARVKKPLGHNCSCWPKVHHMGRMGRWQNGYLVHQVWPDVAELLLLHKEGAL